jgi:hypothetical protein
MVYAMQESTCGCCSCTSSGRSVVAWQPNTSFQDDVRISSIASPWLGMLSTGLWFDIDGLFFCFFIFSLLLDFHVKLSNFSKKYFNLFSLRILFFFFFYHFLDSFYILIISLVVLFHLIFILNLVLILLMLFILWMIENFASWFFWVCLQ